MNLSTFPIFYAGFVCSFLTLVAVGVIPRTKWGMPATLNNLGRVHMQTAGYYLETNQSTVGVHAQERVECFIRWVMFFTVIGAVISLSKFYFRQSEFIGHAAEIVIAEREGFQNYLTEEAARTYRNSAYDGIFDHLDLEQMKQSLRRRFWLAKFLIAVNWLAIRKVQK